MVEVFQLLGSAFVMAGVVGFFIKEIPFKNILPAIKQLFQNHVNQKKFLIGVILCLALAFYARWLFGIGREYYSFLLLVAYLAAITPVDIKEHIIPDRTTIAFAILFALFQLSSLKLDQIKDSVLGMAVGFVLLGLPYLIHRQSIGLGDVKAVSICGIMLGPMGTLYFLFRAFIAIFVYSVVQLLRKKVTLKSETPFAPFLFFAAIL